MSIRSGDISICIEERESEVKMDVGPKPNEQMHSIPDMKSTRLVSGLIWISLKLTTMKST